MQSLWKLYKKIYKKIKLSYDPATLFLGIYQKDSMFCHRGTCTPMIIAALSTIARKWNQSRCLSSNEWTMKIWHIYKMEYYLTVKNSERIKISGKWMELESIK